MTDSYAHPSRPSKEGETQASLRAEILRQISTASNDLSSALAQLSGGSRFEIAMQLTNLAALRQQASTADASALGEMRATVAAAIATAQASASMDRASGDHLVGENLARARSRARQTVQGFVADYYDKHEYDQWLEFSSDSDKEAYRMRESERKKAIDDAEALHTVEGEAIATKLSRDQWRDAADHGANRSPEFQVEGAKLDEASQQLDAAIAANQKPSPSQTEADQHITALSNAGVTVADQSQVGHGVTIDASIVKLLGRG